MTINGLQITYYFYSESLRINTLASFSQSASVANFHINGKKAEILNLGSHEAKKPVIKLNIDGVGSTIFNWTAKISIPTADGGPSEVTFVENGTVSSADSEVELTVPENLTAIDRNMTIEYTIAELNQTATVNI